MSSFRTEFTRTIVKGFRRPVDALSPLAFFLIVTTLLSLGFEGAPVIARDSLAIASIWVTVLLSTLLALSHTYASDYESGLLELIVAYQKPLYLTLLGSFSGLWLIHTLPILLLVPIGAWMMGLDVGVWPILMASLITGSLVFTMFGILGSSVTLGVSRGGVLMAVLILPLYLPVLLLGVGAVQQFATGGAFEFLFLLMCALAVASVTFLPFALGAMLKASQEY